ncbi:APC family permease, partial [Corallococcus exercitus]
MGPFQLLALGVNGIVGVGIFFAPAEVAAQAPGLGAVWAFALTGLA